MKKDYIIELREEEADELMNEHWVGELVRCKDCKWWHESETNNGFGDCGQANGITLKSSDWFCADGERKEE